VSFGNEIADQFRLKWHLEWLVIYDGTNCIFCGLLGGKFVPEWLALHVMAMDSAGWAKASDPLTASAKRQ
jgi:hypothetical protein